MEGPDEVTLGEPLILDVYATRLDEGMWPHIHFDSEFTNRSFVDVRRDSATGPVVPLHAPPFCGVSAWGGGFAPWPAGTVNRQQLVVFDARLTEPGRYVIEVRLREREESSPRVIPQGLPWPVEIVLPEDPEARSVAETIAEAVRVGTGPYYGRDLEVWQTY